MKKICENCGKEFICSHDQNCWCVRYKVSAKLSEYLKTNFKDCLCSECLENHINMDADGSLYLNQNL
jgi:hypothetical protein